MPWYGFRSAVTVTLPEGGKFGDDQFGVSLALVGKTLAVGARLDDQTSPDAGAV